MQGGTGETAKGHFSFFYLGFLVVGDCPLAVCFVWVLVLCDMCMCVRVHAEVRGGLGCLLLLGDRDFH